MDTQEILKIVDSFQSNATAGIFIISYYLIIYWPKIKDGLGLFQSNKTNLDRTKQGYELLKLRIEIEKIKKESNLDQSLLEKLEKEMQDHIEVKHSAPFTNLQKFIAIPFIILIIIQTGMNIQIMDPNAPELISEELFNTVALIILILISFWAIPILQKQKQGRLKKTGFIIFWSFIIYLILAVFVDFIARELFANEEFVYNSLAPIYIIAFLISLVLGLYEKLPLMSSSTKRIQQQ